MKEIELIAKLTRVVKGLAIMVVAQVDEEITGADMAVVFETVTDEINEVDEFLRSVGFTTDQPSDTISGCKEI